MNDSTCKPTLCVGADVHLDQIVLRAVDKALSQEKNRFQSYAFLKCCEAGNE